MAQFDKAIELVLRHEGGYTPGLPGDSGGETNFGISKRSYPDLDIKNLTLEDAKKIYIRDYWALYMAEQEDQQIANCLFDCAVNQGSNFAARLNGLNLQQIQVERLLHYTAINKPQFYRGWFRRTLDV